MASVYAARHSAGLDEIALKIIDPVRAGSYRERLLAEARAAAAVTHPRLVRCLDVGEQSGFPYLVMELVSGGDGDDLMRRQHCRVPLDTLLLILDDVAQALGALHHVGILHRDLKPSNILFGPDGHAQVADFGLAHIEDGAPGVTRAGYTVGTPDYMPPEQARAEPLDGRADLYALGATIYHIATGRTPFPGATAWAVLGSLLSEPFPDVLQRRPDLGSPFASIISKLTAKKREERYADAAELRDDIALVRAGRAPVHARYRSSVELLATAPARASGPMILLIDDDPLVRRIYTAGLGSRGLTCVVAADGTSGLELAARTPVAAAVVDLVLPDIDGAEVVRRLRASYPDLPILVLSNAFAERQLAEARSAGATRVLIKAGTSPSHLAAELGTLLPEQVFVSPITPTDPAVALMAADTAQARIQVLTRRLDAADADDRVLTEIAAAARGLSAAAGAAGLAGVAHLAGALEALARELVVQPARRSASNRRTLQQAASCLRAQLLERRPVAVAGRVLAVDDDRMARVLLTSALSKVGIVHDVVATPAEALQQIASGGHVLLLTDVVMDGMSGLQLAAKARQLPGRSHLPVIFVTGMDEFAGFFAAGEGTGTDLIAKPFLLMELGVKTLVMLASARPAAS
jgi:serine/threonine-protein kinase